MLDLGIDAREHAVVGHAGEEVKADDADGRGRGDGGGPIRAAGGSQGSERGERAAGDGVGDGQAEFGGVVARAGQGVIGRRWR